MATFRQLPTVSGSPANRELNRVPVKDPSSGSHRLEAVLLRGPESSYDPLHAATLLHCFVLRIHLHRSRTPVDVHARLRLEICGQAEFFPGSRFF